MRNLILQTFLLALLIPPLSLSSQSSFSLSLDVNGSAGDQAVTSLNMSADQVVAIQMFATDIQNANGLAVRFEYDASQVTYEGFDVGDVLPNTQALPGQSTNPTFVEIGIVSLGGQATANSFFLPFDAMPLIFAVTKGCKFFVAVKTELGGGVLVVHLRHVFVPQPKNKGLRIVCIR